MTCKKTELLVVEYLEADMSAGQRSILERHLRDCAHCRQDLSAAQRTQTRLRHWQDEAVPQWNRIPESLQQAGKPRQWSGFFGWQWAPLSVSFLLALAVLFNVQVSPTPNGIVVAFGGSAGINEAELAEHLTRLEQQEDQLQALTVRMEERQDAANGRLLESVLTQFGETSSRSLEQVIAYVEEQRQQDLQLLQSSYQQLADSDFQTIRSVQELATYVQYQAGSR